MPEWIKSIWAALSSWWGSLSTAMRWFIMVVVVAIIVFMMYSFVFMGTDWSGPFSFLSGLLQ